MRGAKAGIGGGGASRTFLSVDRDANPLGALSARRAHRGVPITSAARELSESLDPNGEVLIKSAAGIAAGTGADEVNRLRIQAQEGVYVGGALHA